MPRCPTTPRGAHINHAPKEKQVVSKIMAAAKKIPGLVLRKRHGTAMGCGGDPDLYGSFRGRHVEIEVKVPYVPKSQLTKLQTYRQHEWSVDGQAVVGVARSIDEFLAILALVAPELRHAESVWLCAGCRQYRWQGDDAPARCPACGHIHFERESEAKVAAVAE